MSYRRWSFFVAGAAAALRDTVEHEAEYFASVRSGKPPAEHAAFGHHAATSCYMENFSYFQQQPAMWDQAGKRIKT